MKYLKIIKISNNIVSLLIVALSALTIYFVYNNFFKAVQNLKDISLIKYDVFVNTITDPKKWQSAVQKIEDKKNNSLLFNSEELENPFLLD